MMICESGLLFWATLYKMKIFDMEGLRKMRRNLKLWWYLNGFRR